MNEKDNSDLVIFGIFISIVCGIIAIINIDL